MLYLGIDGGGTGCRAAVCDAAGQILGTGQGGPANIATDPDGARQNVLQAAAEALPAGARLEDLGTVMGLAGANVAAAVLRFRQGLPLQLCRIETDAMIAVKGALGARDGVVAVIGTGSVFAQQRAGQLREIGGWGLILGDDASGAWIGRAILARALRAVDGFVPMTPLLQALIGERGGPDGIVSFASAASPADFATLAPRIVASDDPAARTVMAAADAAVAAALSLLGASDALPVVFLGGLGVVFATRLQGRWPQLSPLGSALEGALFLARQG